MDATYDAIKAFQINASYNDLYNVSDTLREDVNAAISTFMQSLSMNMGVGGYNKNHMNNYIPAILFTLYDGYYIYSSAKTDSGYEYMLKPYNYYTARYVHGNIDVVVNYTLDNYIVVYGWFGDSYKVRAGYLVTDDKSSIVNGNETLKENVPYKNISTGELSIGEKYITDANYDPEYVNNLAGAPDTRTDYLYPRNENFYVDPKSAQYYYEEARDFTKWVEDNLGEIVASDAVSNATKIEEFQNDYDRSRKIFDFNTSDNNPEDSTSLFAQHKTRVIKTSIQNNLNQAITAFSQGATSTYDFKLPKLEENEWDFVSSNICMLTFMQGVPMGNKYYNNYALVQSTTNKLYVDPDSLYFVSEGGDGYYHKIDCDHLTGTNIIGYSNFEFLLKRLKLSSDTFEYYYRHLRSGVPMKACYYCIVDSNYEKTDWQSNSEKAKAYYTALAREKYTRYKATKHLYNE